MVGESTADKHSFKGVVKKSVVCINRLHPETTDTMISDFLKLQGINVLSCFQYKSSHDRYVFMRVCVSQPDVHKLYNADCRHVAIGCRGSPMEV